MDLCRARTPEKDDERHIRGLALIPEQFVVFLMVNNIQNKKEYENLIKKQGIGTPSTLNFVTDKITAATAIRNIFARTKSNAMIFAPDINLLKDLDFESLRPMARVQVATPFQQNMQLVNELLTRPNIEIRNYTEGAIWGIIRDNEELLLAPLGENKEPNGPIVKGDIQIDMFGTIMRSTWTRLKRVQ